MGWGVRERPTGRTVLLWLVNAAVCRGPRLQLDWSCTEHQVTCSTGTSGKRFSGEGAKTTGP